MTRRVSPPSISFAVALGIVLTGVVVAPEPVSGSKVSGSKITSLGSDFDCDGWDDLAIGVPGENVGPVSNAGIVHVLRGRRDGLTARGDLVLHQVGSGGLESKDLFGASIATGDFDGDGCDDLAIGAPGERVGEETSKAGAVSVAYGSDDHPLARMESFTGAAPSQDMSPEEGANLGEALGAGDFNGDGYADLAIGIPERDVFVHAGAGSVLVVYGSSQGMRFATADEDGRVQLWHQDVDGVLDEAEGGSDVGKDSWEETNERFGSSLASGDFDGDGYGDLAVGVSGEIVQTSALEREEEAGAVQILYGSWKGLASLRNQILDQGTPGIKGKPEVLTEEECRPCEQPIGDRFGATVASGDFDADGFDDLVVGIPDEVIDDLIHVSMPSGAVAVLHGSSDGVSTRDQLWTQWTPGVKGTPEGNEALGAAVAAGDFDADGYDDLAIGVPWESVGRDVRAPQGAVHILRGSRRSLTSEDDRFIHQASPGIKDSPDPDDRFGYSLRAGRFGRSAADDLAIGVIGEWISAPNGLPPPYRGDDGGAVAVLYGSETGLSAEGDQLLAQNTRGMGGSAQEGDRFGFVGPLYRREQGDHHTS